MLHGGLVHEGTQIAAGRTKLLVSPKRRTNLLLVHRSRANQAGGE
jgi:hypothetical protein